MKPYKFGNRNSFRWLKIALLAGVLLIVLGAGTYYGVNKFYQHSLQPVDVSSTQEVNFTVSSGSTPAGIAERLKEENLIRSSRAFTQYVRSNDYGESFKAGTYKLKRSMSVQEIVTMMTEGNFATDLFTIYPGSTLADVKRSFLEKTHYSETEVDQALDPAQYAGHPALVDLPAGASLSGFLYPDSYEFIAETTPSTIVKQSLDEMAEALTPEVRAGIAKQGLSVYQGVILASLIEKEVAERDTNGQINDNRQKVAQVFLKRLKEGIKLESNATDEAAEKLGAQYDTYQITGLPPEPVSNVTKSSLNAVISPSPTSYLFFVSGTDCVTRFSETNDQHEALKAQYGIATDCRG